MKSIPNLLTGLRLVLGIVMFLCLAGAAGGIPFLSGQLTPASQFALERIAFFSFVVAGITDFFDGWVARRFHAVTLWGSILDPIADKVLICGVILGLAALGPEPQIATPAAIILFREFAVSALREASAGKGVSLPVTLLAKWKTTIQLIALGSVLLITSWSAFNLPSDPLILGPAIQIAYGLMWVAAILTLWTGAVYWHSAHKALAD